MIKDDAIYTLLSEIPALSGIQISPDASPESSDSTYIVYQLVSLQEGAYTLTGKAGLVPLRYQIDVYSPDKTVVNSLSESIIAGLYDAVLAVLINQSANFEPETRLHRMMLNISIYFDN